MDGEVMSDNSFFKPTLLYKEFMILDLIEKDANITQREISKTIGVAVSMVNQYIENFVEKGLIKKKKHSTKTVEYFITKKGAKRKKVLNISYLNASLNIYKSAKENIVEFLTQIINKGYENILLYGAGEVAEILLQTILIDSQIPINVLAVIDDDESKLGKTLVSKKIISLDRVNEYQFDGILISSYTNQKLILDKLLAVNYQKENILHFFD
jgi:DNA-binding MarR family transcriptional regulator